MISNITDDVGIINLYNPVFVREFIHYILHLKVKQFARQTKKAELTDTDSSSLVPEGEEGGGRGSQINGDRKRPDSGWCVHSATHR